MDQYYKSRIVSLTVCDPITQSWCRVLLFVDTYKKQTNINKIISRDPGCVRSYSLVKVDTESLQRSIIFEVSINITYFKF